MKLFSSFSFDIDSFWNSKIKCRHYQDVTEVIKRFIKKIMKGNTGSFHELLIQFA